MNYSGIKNYDIANGLGIRLSLFVSGCKNHCKGCFNRDTWDFNYGQAFTDETIQQILDMLKPEEIDGITILGGDPMETENQPSVLKLIKSIREKYPEKTIWLYTGYTLDEDIISSNGKRHIPDCSIELISMCDIIVDGRFVLELKDLALNYRGSSNQRIIAIDSGKNTKRPDYINEVKRGLPETLYYKL
jgi:anaerobic ribonucleoside-triphosphate reductase activating protein